MRESTDCYQVLGQLECEGSCQAAKEKSCDFGWTADQRCALRGSGLIVTVFRLSSQSLPNLLQDSHLHDAVPQGRGQSSTRWRTLISAAPQSWKRLVSSHAGSFRTYICGSPNTHSSPPFRCYQTAYLPRSRSYAQLDHEDPGKHRVSSVECPCGEFVCLRRLRNLSNPHVANGNSYRRRHP
jgi:hypothetical protein